MPKVHYVKSARKPIPSIGVQKGDSYYWWEFRVGGKRVSKLSPTRQQLTQSDFLIQLYDIEDKIESITVTTQEEFQAEKEEILEMIEALKDETQERLEAMPEHLQESSSSGQLLQERIDGLDEWYSEIDCVECEYDEDEIRQEFQEEERDEDTGQIDEAVVEEKVREKIQEIVDQAVEELKDCQSNLG